MLTHLENVLFIEVEAGAVLPYGVKIQAGLFSDCQRKCKHYDLCYAQKEVLEELEHHFPLDLLVELSEAAIATLQASPWVVSWVV